VKRLKHQSGEVALLMVVAALIVVIAGVGVYVYTQRSQGTANVPLETKSEVTSQPKTDSIPPVISADPAAAAAEAEGKAADDENIDDANPSDADAN
jgi:uncharacterized protein (UPF0333 family)